MGDSDDEFGGLDDEAMLLAVASAERPHQDVHSRAPKRQRLSSPAAQAPPRMITSLTKHGGRSDLGRSASVGRAIPVASQADDESDDGFDPPRRQLRAPQTNLKQTTLFGAPQTPASDDDLSQTQTRSHNWPLASRSEAPTHHRLDHAALQSWTYPTNVGSIRDYQFNIVARGLYHNLLVALPTGLGKTFIAATIMLNWYRWTDDAQIVFVAPTRPLVSQQVDACFRTAGIPRSATTMLTGGIPPGVRAEEWSAKRVFFMTPQTIINDLKTGICDPKRIVLLVVDEAHRATGGYAYVEVVKFLRRFNTSFRVLALTATPGSTVEGVQEVIDGLGISRVEIRTEDSLDIRQYVHHRNIETTVFEYSEELIMCMDLFAKALQPLVNKLRGMNAYWSQNPMTLTPYGCTQARQKWMNTDAGQRASWPVKNMVMGVFSILASLAHAIELLKFHGVGPFYHKLVTFRTENEGKGEKGSKHKEEIIKSEPFQTLMSRIQTWVSDRSFIGHPKLEALRSIALNHFMDAGEGRQEGQDQISPARTRIMVFAHYRDSAEEIVRVLKRDEPMIRPHVFVGQANSKESEGMNQKTQLEIIDKFRRGVFNTLVATSIGEEGLDIGEVNLIVCYDGSASPIRMLQRMGRTGRKRAGQIEVLLMKDKEYDNFLKAKDNYEKMQEMIASGKRFTFHEELSPRIVPRDIQPLVDKREVEIPIENTQPDLPEPKKRAKPPKRPPKKFHMPDNAQLGFTTVARLISGEEERASTKTARQSPSPEPVPPNSAVFLTDAETKELERVYQSISGEEAQVVEPPRLDAHPAAQREFRPTAWISHSRASRVLSKMVNAMHEFSDPFASLDRFEKNLLDNDRKLVDGCASHDSGVNSSHMEGLTQSEIGQEGDHEDLGEDIQSETQHSLEGDGDPQDASDLADFIDDGELSIVGADSPSSSSSPPLPLTERDPPLSQTYIVLSQTPSLSTLLGSEARKGTDNNAKVEAIARRRKAVIDSDSDD